MELSQRQLEEFAENGVLIFPRLFNLEEVKILSNSTSKVTKKIGLNVTPEINTEGVRMVHGAHEYENSFAHLCRHPRIVKPAEQLLQSKIYLHQSRLNVNSGFGSGGFSWHQDYATWKDVDGLPEPRALMIAVFFDDVDSTNGPLLFFPGSHKKGVIEDFEPVEDKTGNVLMCLSKSRLAELEKEFGIQAGLGPAGTVLFMHCNLVHGSTSNISPKSRTLFYVNVNSVENQQTTFAREIFHAGRDFSPIIAVENDILLY